MCGFAGVLRLKGLADFDFPDTLRTMGGTIQHRGPDDETYHIDGDFGVAFRRLSIIDVGGGRQPFFNEDRSVVCFMNGEILNYVELRGQLAKLGHRLVSDHSDTEVIPHLYEEFGDAFVDHLVGMFSIVLWDSRRRRLLLIRDRFGIKPLFVAETAGALVFASEIKAILASGLVSREPDPVARDMAFHANFVLPPRTMFAGVSAIKPGHMLVIGDGKPRHVRYYHLAERLATREDSRLGGVELADTVYDQIDSVMAMWFRADVPIGISQSGGIDSSILMHHAGRHVDRVVSITVDFESADFFPDEVRFASVMAQRVGADHKIIRVGSNRLLDRLPAAMWVADNVNLVTTAINQYLVAEEAANHVKVLFSGSGGDELFVGYPWYEFNMVEKSFAMMPRPMREAALLLLSPMSAIGGKAAVVYDWLTSWRDFAHTYPKKHIYRTRLMYPREIRRLFGVDYQGDEIEGTYADYLAEIYDGDILNALSYLDMFTFVAAHQTNQTDYASMAHSIENRPPLLDHRLVELMLSIPSAEKTGPRNEKKYLLKQAYRAHIPQEILYGKKVGFSSPLHQWVDERFTRVARHVLVDRTPPCLARCDGALIDYYVRNCSKSWKYAEFVYGLLAYATWYRVHVELGMMKMPRMGIEEFWQ